MKKDPRRRAVSATSAAKSFGSLIDRVREAGAVYAVESHGQVVAEIRPATRRFTIGDLSSFFSEGPRAPEDLLDAVEAGRREARTQPPEPVAGLSGRGGTPRRSGRRRPKAR